MFIVKATNIYCRQCALVLTLCILGMTFLLVGSVSAQSTVEQRLHPSKTIDLNAREARTAARFQANLEALAIANGQSPQALVCASEVWVVVLGTERLDAAINDTSALNPLETIERIDVTADELKNIQRHIAIRCMRSAQIAGNARMFGISMAASQCFVDRIISNSDLRPVLFDQRVAESAYFQKVMMRNLNQCYRSTLTSTDKATNVIANVFIAALLLFVIQRYSKEAKVLRRSSMDGQLTRVRNRAIARLLSIGGHLVIVALATSLIYSMLLPRICWDLDVCQPTSYIVSTYAMLGFFVITALATTVLGWKGWLIGSGHWAPSERQT